MARSGAATRSLAAFGVAWALCACGDEPPPQESRTSVPMREMGRKPQAAEPDALDAYHAALAEPVAEPEAEMPLPAAEPAIPQVALAGTNSGSLESGAGAESEAAQPAGIPAAGGGSPAA